MITLQDLKNKIEEIEKELEEENLTLEMIPIQTSISNEFTDIDIEIYQYGDFKYAYILLE